MQDNGNSPVVITPPSNEGTYDFVIRYQSSVSPAGNRDAQALSGNGVVEVFYRLTVDNTAPDTVIDTGPTGTVNSTSATFTYHSTEANSTFETRLDNGAWVSNGTATSKTYPGLSQAPHTFDVRATDEAGNTDASPASRSWTVQTDSTAPVITKTIAGTNGSNGWYKSDVTVTWTVTDPDSAVVIDSGCGTQNFTSNTAGATSSCTAHSAGGSASDSVTVKIDKDAPTVTANADRPADHNGWYNAPLTVSFSGTDVTSGPVSCDANVTYGDDASETDGTSKSVSSTCSDDAGNTASATYNFKYDNTNPTVTGALAHAADHNGWYNAPVDYSFSGTDVTSGIDAASCTSGTYNGPDGTGLTVNGSCADLAGNTASANTSAFKYDNTNPSANANADRPADHNGWYNAPLTVNFSGTDVTSGPVSCSPASTTYGDDASETDGTGKSVSSTCSDDAGNTASATYNFKYDNTDPTVAGALARGTDHNGWYNAPVGYSFAGSSTDTTSNIDAASCTSGTYGDNASEVDGTGLTVSGSCSDNAGNSANGSTPTFKYDNTDPTVAGALARGTDHNGWYNAPVDYSFSGTDVTSNIDAASCTSGTYGDNASEVDGTGLTVSGSCSDNAGNSANGSTPTFKFDNTDPTTPTFSGIQAKTYPVADLPLQSAISCSSTDATSSPAACAFTGYSSAFGSQTLNATATDQAGNTKNSSLTYIVGEQAGEVQSPINSLGKASPTSTNLDSFKIKSTVPVKFKLYNDAAMTQLMTNPPAGSVARLTFFKQDNTTDTTDLTDTLTGLTPNTDNIFRWTGATDYQYIYNLGTTGKAAGTYGVQLTLYDSSASDATVLAQSAKYYFVLRT